MNPMRNWKTLAGLVVLGSSISCGDVVRQGRGPMFLVIDSLTGSRGGGTAGAGTSVLLSDVITNVRSPAPCTATAPCPTVFNDTGAVLLRLSPKDVATGGASNAPSTNNQVTITRYRVVYRRADGRNVPGVDVPYGFDGAATGTVPMTGTFSLGFELVRHIAKQESPLMQLAASSSIITTIADVTFYGRDQVGNDISATGSIQIDFGNFGDL
jgi:hypothetical protein